MFKILMTADTVGGVWTYALQLASALSECQVDIHLAVMGPPLSDEQRDAARRHANLTLYESAYKLEWMQDPWSDVRAAGDWLLDLEQRLQPDLIHLNGYAHGALPFHAPVLIVAHSCVCSWFRAVKQCDAPAEWREYRRQVTAGLRGAARVVAPSQAMLEALARHYGPLPPASVIYNARSGVTFRPGAKMRCIFSAGRFWDEAKNIAALDAIAPDLPWPVYVAGDTAHPALNARAATSHVQYLGRLSETRLASWLALSSIYALPARYEPFGLSILEAALAGCALVLGNIPSLREIWQDAAFFVPPDDHASLAAALDHLMSDAPQRLRLAGKAQLQAARYSLPRMAHGYVRLYQSLVNPRGPAAGSDPAHASLRPRRASLSDPAEPPPAIAPRPTPRHVG